MIAVSVFLNWAALIIFFAGTGVSAMLAGWLFIPVLAVSIAMLSCSHYIQRKSKIAAQCGVAFMLLLTVVGLLFPFGVAAKFSTSAMMLLMVAGVFFPLGLVGLLSAYKNRSKWTAW